MNYGSIKELDTANGVGCRTSLFVSGCTHHCKGCFNEVTWDFGYGKPYTSETEDYILKTLNNDYVDGISILGGEPFEPENQYELISLLAFTTILGKNIWMYSGYTYEELTDPNSRCHTECTDIILSLIDVLVDGEFIEEQKDISLQYRGSKNQRLIDVQETRKQGKIVLWKGVK